MRRTYTFLQAPFTFRTPPGKAGYTGISDSKPPAPGMLLVNSRVYRDAKEIPSSRNTFSFLKIQYIPKILG